MNDYLHETGRNPKGGNEMKKKYMNIANRSIRYWLKGWHTDKPVTIHYEIGEVDYKRDISNVVFCAVKFIEDSLQICNVINNDSPKYVRGLSCEVKHINKTKKPYIKVTIKELDDS